MRRTIIGAALLAILVVAVIAGVWIAHVAAVAPVTPVHDIVVPPPPRPENLDSGNPANDRLANLTSTEQATVLGKKIGHGCTGIAAFPMGIGRHDADRGDAYWSVRCADGESYAVALHPDKAGSVSVLGCDAMHSAGMDCFKRLPRG
ncbi:MAG TPA: hypothetical protein VE397_10520 [Stellaceae bacterium]|nr:hypothetical protein [Stellaceae bacterium]